jgi:predicted metalloprotease
MRRLLTLLLLLTALAGAGCGGQEADRFAADVRHRAEEVQARVRTVGDRARQLARQVQAALEKIRKSVPSANSDAQAPTTGGRTEPTLRAAGRREPRVSYLWVPPGRVVQSGCGAPAGPDAAFYCPADDTIYVAQELAARIWRGVANNFPGERAGQGKAVGDFGLAYVVAHEYAHNVQQELGIAEFDPQLGVEPLELQADCMAGLWGNSVYRQGKLAPGDVEEAISTAMAAGDFDLSNPQHHGTPEQRRDAWLLGYESGDPARCGAIPGV